MRGRVPGSLLQISSDSSKPTKMIAKQEINFGRTVENVISLKSY